MGYTEDEKALIWLSLHTEIEPRERVRLLRAAASPAELFRLFEKFSSPLIKKAGDGVYKRGTLGEREEELGGFLEELEESGIFAVTAVSDDYPKQLLAAEPPLVLFGAGNRSLLKERMFCIVGSRITPAWAEKAGAQVAEEIAEKFVVVTGFAEGGDSAAIRGALPCGRLVCVLPCGLEECYPAAHYALKEKVKEHGLLLSEYLPREPAKKYSFHARNRILAGLAEGVLVISAGEKSGALITVNRALAYGRDVFAFPYNLGAAQGAGCNELIKRGAYLCTGAQDIYDCYGFLSEKREQADLTEQEAQLLALLREEGEMHAAVLAERTGMPVFETAAVLSALELKGLVVKAGGNRYASYH